MVEINMWKYLLYTLKLYQVSNLGGLVGKYLYISDFVFGWFGREIPVFRISDFECGWFGREIPVYFGYQTLWTNSGNKSSLPKFLRDTKLSGHYILIYCFCFISEEFCVCKKNICFISTHFFLNSVWRSMENKLSRFPNFCSMTGICCLKKNGFLLILHSYMERGVYCGFT